MDHTHETREKIEFCPNDIDAYLPDTLQAEEDWCSDPAIITLLNNIISTQLPARSDAPFIWSMAEGAKKHNAAVLESYNIDVQKCIESHPDSIIKPESEFQPIQQLDQIYHRHPNWAFIRNTITNGANMLGNQIIPPTSCQQENEEMIRYNNHK
jgi:hypothetical protein